jgi:hypothetical protein
MKSRLVVLASILVLAVLWFAIGLGEETQPNRQPARPEPISDQERRAADSSHSSDRREATDQGQLAPDSPAPSDEETSTTEEPWFVDMSHVSMTGLTMRDYLANWHPETWEEILPTLEGVDFFDHEFTSEVELGEPLPCLEGMPELLAAAYWDLPGGEQILRRSLYTVPGFKQPIINHEERLIVATKSPLYNFTLREIAQQGDEWDEAVEWIKTEWNELTRFVEPFFGEVELAIRSDLQGLSATQKPRYGEIMFGPFYTRSSLSYGGREQHGAFFVDLWAGDTVGECKKFTASYVLALDRHPDLQESIRQIRTYRTDLQNRLVSIVGSLP